MKPKTLFLVLAVLAAVCAVNASLATGAARTISVSFMVNSNVDATDINPGNGVCETAPGNNMCTLRAAIQETNALPGDDVINLPSDIYTITLSGRLEDAAAKGDLDITDNLTIIGAGPAITVIDANNLDRIFHIVTSSTVNLSGLTIKRGNSGSSSGGGILIGGMGAVQPTLVLTAVTVLDNRTGNEGGGIMNWFGALTLMDVTVISNTASSTGGGVNNMGVFTITSSAIVSNVSNYRGGGLYTDRFAPSTISNTLIQGNSTPGDGGGVYIFNDGILTLDSTTVMSNTSLYRGGGIYAAGPLTMTNSTVSGNSAGESGGGIEYYTYRLAILNSTISRNQAASDGGGVAGGFALSLNNVTLTENRADADGNGSGNGGGIYFPGGDSAIKNTIIAGNIDQGGEAPDCWGSLTSQDYNLIQSTVGCELTGMLTHNKTGLKPYLGPLQDNGGSTPTHALFFFSPAVDAGNNATCAAADQRGSLRPVDGDNNGSAICDIGAFEMETVTIHRTHLPLIQRNP